MTQLPSSMWQKIGLVPIKVAPNDGPARAPCRLNVHNENTPSDQHHPGWASPYKHQDKNIQGPFTRDMMLNIEVDQLACNKLTSYSTGPQQFHIPWSQEVCYTGTQHVEKTLETPYTIISMALPQKPIGKNKETWQKESGTTLIGNQ